MHNHALSPFTQSESRTCGRFDVDAERKQHRIDVGPSDVWRRWAAVYPCQGSAMLGLHGDKPVRVGDAMRPQHEAAETGAYCPGCRVADTSSMRRRTWPYGTRADAGPKDGRTCGKHAGVRLISLGTSGSFVCTSIYGPHPICIGVAVSSRVMGRCSLAEVLRTASAPA